MSANILSFVVAVGVVAALRPNTTSICDYYTPLVLGKENTPANQQELMALITHIFILGNYTTPNVGVKVDGIAGPFTYEGHDVNLLPYFTGGYYSTNENGKPVAKNFLDDGGAGALLANKPANTTTSNQYKLLTHVYQYFGDFYGCSQQGVPDFPHYQGVASMWEVHKFMDPNVWEAGYFNEQIVLAGKSIGFEEPDVNFTREALDQTFTYRCIPPAAVIPPSAGPQLQTICSDVYSCPLAANANCSAYPDNGVVPYPEIANVTLLQGVPKENDTLGLSSTSTSSSASASATASGSAATPRTSSTNAAAYTLAAGNSMVALGSMVALLGMRLLL
ncbi:uncharacterized protein A1O5_01666 [Cladophialophora psammophila CBS 110553]|uniref:Heme haloperoxidase family profile domain-containing protein n=1 Tax=Cladophialophora psammophila CBS 110553 TaxID=1182543 RepID=W9XCC6_9EURO|nr:uncharacterized protein A1O5_01666 [Cladophialophora psammophila CBS 110553]EXJ74970.1 hypothetical protein A1O5_01666 [Cladophialophora psammophila CBS 110553]